MAHEIDQHGDTTSLHKGHEINLTRDKRGFWSGTQVYFLHRDYLMTLTPANGSAHPDYDWLKLETVAASDGEGDWLKLDCEYAGIDASLENADPNDPPQPVYTLDLALSEEPLETHPRYVDALDEDDLQEAVTKAKSPARDSDGELVEVDTTGWSSEQVELYNSLRRGFDKFRDPKVTWTMEWVSDARPGNLNDIGEIDNPAGNPPAVAAGRNWLFSGLTSVERAASFENTKVWELSGRGGWDTTIYS